MPETFALLIIHKLNVARFGCLGKPRGPSVKRQMSGLQDHGSCNEKKIKQPADNTRSDCTVRNRIAGYFGATAF